MSEKRYFISDAAKQLEVEPHVLRYWEEELNMKIRRNEQGHRYYVEKDLRVLRKVKELKNGGITLKIVKQVVPELYENEEVSLPGLFTRCHEMMLQEEGMETNNIMKFKQNKPTGSTEVVSSAGTVPTFDTSKEKMKQFQDMMSRIVANAIVENQNAIAKAASQDMSDKVIKEMNYALNLNDEKEEERFKRLDETIREYQKARLETAATLEEQTKKRRFGRRKRKKDA